MNVFNLLIKSFSSNYQLSSSREDFDIFEQKFCLQSIGVPSELELNQAIESLGDSNSITIYINIDQSDDDITFSKGADYNVFRSDLEIKIGGIEADTVISVKLIVRKHISQNRLAIFSIEDFKSYLEAFSTYDLIDFFSEKINHYNKVIFCSNDIHQNCETASFAFGSTLNEQQVNFALDNETRGIRIKNIQSSTHATSLSDKMLIPDDFHSIRTLPEQLKAIFDKVNFTLIIMAIFDITHLSDNILKFQINGYKSIDGSVDTTLIPVVDYIDEYREIYNWIYRSGNLNDKLGLARNIISLHLDKENDLSFKGNMFNSILSAYKVYEKQNIKQYIEIRNKLSDQLIDYNKRASIIVETFASAFQKSALSVLTLFSSIIALKVLGSSNTSENFVVYSVIFSIVIILISFIYMVISRAEAIEQKKRFATSYENFKERYTDLLNVDDIRRILNEDKEFNADIHFIEKKIINYTALWAVILTLICIFTVLYFLYENIK